MDSGKSKSARTRKTSLKTPWLDRHGRMRSLKCIKHLSKTWSADKWESYLKSIDVELSESLLREREQKALERKAVSSAFEFATPAAESQLQLQFEIALRDFTYLQKKIVELLFWERLSERAIADKLRLSRSTIKTLKKRILKRLQSKVGRQSPKSTYVWGEISLPEKTGDSIAPENLESAEEMVSAVSRAA